MRHTSVLPSRLVVLLPASVKAGEFTVEVKMNAKRPSKTVKKGAYKKALLL